MTKILAIRRILFGMDFASFEEIDNTDHGSVVLNGFVVMRIIRIHMIRQIKCKRFLKAYREE